MSRKISAEAAQAASSKTLTPAELAKKKALEEEGVVAEAEGRVLDEEAVAQESADAGTQQSSLVDEVSGEEQSLAEADQQAAEEIERIALELDAGAASLELAAKDIGMMFAQATGNTTTGAAAATIGGLNTGAVIAGVAVLGVAAASGGGSDGGTPAASGGGATGSSLSGMVTTAGINYTVPTVNLAALTGAAPTVSGTASLSTSIGRTGLKIIDLQTPSASTLTAVTADPVPVTQADVTAYLAARTTSTIKTAAVKYTQAEVNAYWDARWSSAQIANYNTANNKTIPTTQPPADNADNLAAYNTINGTSLDSAGFTNLLTNIAPTTAKDKTPAVTYTQAEVDAYQALAPKVGDLVGGKSFLANYTDTTTGTGDSLILINDATLTSMVTEANTDVNAGDASGNSILGVQFKGGIGYDVVSAAIAGNLDASTNAKTVYLDGIESLRIDSTVTGAGAVVNASKFGALQELWSYESLALRLTSVASTDTVIGVYGGGAATTVTYAATATGTDKQLTAVLHGTGAGTALTFNTAATVTGSIDSVLISSNGTTAASTNTLDSITTIEAAGFEGIKTLRLQGDNALTIGSVAGMAEVTKVDGSGMKGNFTLGMGNISTVDYAVEGGAGTNVVNTTVNANGALQLTRIATANLTLATSGATVNFDKSAGISKVVLSGTLAGPETAFTKTTFSNVTTGTNFESASVAAQGLSVTYKDLSDFTYTATGTATSSLLSSLGSLTLDNARVVTLKATHGAVAAGGGLTTGAVSLSDDAVALTVSNAGQSAVNVGTVTATTKSDFNFTISSEGSTSTLATTNTVASISAGGHLFGTVSAAGNIDVNVTGNIATTGGDIALVLNAVTSDVTVGQTAGSRIQALGDIGITATARGATSDAGHDVSVVNQTNGLILSLTGDVGLKLNTTGSFATSDNAGTITVGNVRAALGEVTVNVDAGGFGSGVAVGNLDSEKNIVVSVETDPGSTVGIAQAGGIFSESGSVGLYVNNGSSSALASTVRIGVGNNDTTRRDIDATDLIDVRIDNGESGMVQIGHLSADKAQFDISSGVSGTVRIGNTDAGELISVSTEVATSGTVRYGDLNATSSTIEISGKTNSVAADGLLQFGAITATNEGGTVSIGSKTDALDLASSERGSNPGARLVVSSVQADGNVSVYTGHGASASTTISGAVVSNSGAVVIDVKGIGSSAADDAALTIGGKVSAHTSLNLSFVGREDSLVSLRALESDKANVTVNLSVADAFDPLLISSATRNGAIIQADNIQAVEEGANVDITVSAGTGANIDLAVNGEILADNQISIDISTGDATTSNSIGRVRSLSGDITLSGDIGRSVDTINSVLTVGNLDANGLGGTVTVTGDGGALSVGDAARVAIANVRANGSVDLDVAFEGSTSRFETQKITSTLGGIALTANSGRGNLETDDISGRNLVDIDFSGGSSGVFIAQGNIDSSANSIDIDIVGGRVDINGRIRAIAPTGDVDLTLTANNNSNIANNNVIFAGDDVNLMLTVARSRTVNVGTTTIQANDGDVTIGAAINSETGSAATLNLGNITATGTVGGTVTIASLSGTGALAVGEAGTFDTKDITARNAINLAYALDDAATANMEDVTSNSGTVTITSTVTAGAANLFMDDVSGRGLVKIDYTGGSTGRFEAGLGENTRIRSVANSVELNLAGGNIDTGSIDATSAAGNINVVVNASQIARVADADTQSIRAGNDVNLTITTARGQTSSVGMQEVEAITGDIVIKANVGSTTGRAGALFFGNLEATGSDGGTITMTSIDDSGALVVGNAGTVDIKNITSRGAMDLDFSLGAAATANMEDVRSTANAVSITSMSGNGNLLMDTVRGRLLVDIDYAGGTAGKFESEGITSDTNSIDLNLVGGNIDVTGALNATAAAGNITVAMSAALEGKLSASSTISAGNDVNLTLTSARSKLTQVGAVNSLNGDITVTSTVNSQLGAEGKTIIGSLTADGLDGTGEISINGTVNADGNLEVGQVRAEGDVNVNVDLIGEAARFELAAIDTRNGSIAIDVAGELGANIDMSQMLSQGAIDIALEGAESSAVILRGSIVSTQDEVDVSVTVGDHSSLLNIAAGGITSELDLTLEVVAGAAVTSGAVGALRSNQGNIAITVDLNQDSDTDGSKLEFSTANAVNGTISLDASVGDSSKVEFTSITAGGDVTLTSDFLRDARLDVGAVTSNEGGASLTVTGGAVAVGANIEVTSITAFEDIGIDLATGARSVINVAGSLRTTTGEVDIKVVAGDDSRMTMSNGINAETGVIVDLTLGANVENATVGAITTKTGDVEVDVALNSGNVGDGSNITFGDIRTHSGAVTIASDAVGLDSDLKFNAIRASGEIDLDVALERGGRLETEAILSTAGGVVVAVSGDAFQANADIQSVNAFGNIEVSLEGGAESDFLIGGKLNTTDGRIALTANVEDDSRIRLATDLVAEQAISVVLNVGANVESGRLGNLDSELGNIRIDASIAAGNSSDNSDVTIGTVTARQGIVDINLTALGTESDFDMGHISSYKQVTFDATAMSREARVDLGNITSTTESIAINATGAVGANVDVNVITARTNVVIGVSGTDSADYSFGNIDAITGNVDAIVTGTTRSEVDFGKIDAGRDIDVTITVGANSDVKAAAVTADAGNITLIGSIGSNATDDTDVAFTTLTATAGTISVNLTNLGAGAEFDATNLTAAGNITVTSAMGASSRVDLTNVDSKAGSVTVTLTGGASGANLDIQEVDARDNVTINVQGGARTDIAVGNIDGLNGNVDLIVAGATKTDIDVAKIDAGRDIDVSLTLTGANSDFNAQALTADAGNVTITGTIGSTLADDSDIVFTTITATAGAVNIGTVSNKLSLGDGAEFDATNITAGTNITVVTTLGIDARVDLSDLDAKAGSVTVTATGGVGANVDVLEVDARNNVTFTITAGDETDFTVGNVDALTGNADFILTGGAKTDIDIVKIDAGRDIDLRLVLGANSDVNLAQAITADTGNILITGDVASTSRDDSKVDLNGAVTATAGSVTVTFSNLGTSGVFETQAITAGTSIGITGTVGSNSKFLLDNLDAKAGSATVTITGPTAISANFEAGKIDARDSVTMTLTGSDRADFTTSGNIDAATGSTTLTITGGTKSDVDFVKIDAGTNVTIGLTLGANSDFDATNVTADAGSIAITAAITSTATDDTTVDFGKLTSATTTTLTGTLGDKTDFVVGDITAGGNVSVRTRLGTDARIDLSNVDSNGGTVTILANGDSAGANVDVGTIQAVGTVSFSVLGGDGTVVRSGNSIESQTANVLLVIDTNDGSANADFADGGNIRAQTGIRANIDVGADSAVDFGKMTTTTGDVVIFVPTSTIGANSKVTIEDITATAGATTVTIGRLGFNSDFSIDNINANNAITVTGTIDEDARIDLDNLRSNNSTVSVTVLGGAEGANLDVGTIDAFSNVSIKVFGGFETDVDVGQIKSFSGTLTANIDVGQHSDIMLSAGANAEGDINWTMTLGANSDFDVTTDLISNTGNIEFNFVIQSTNILDTDVTFEDVVADAGRIRIDGMGTSTMQLGQGANLEFKSVSAERDLILNVTQGIDSVVRMTGGAGAAGAFRSGYGLVDIDLLGGNVGQIARFQDIRGDAGTNIKFVAGDASTFTAANIESRTADIRIDTVMGNNANLAISGDLDAETNIVIDLVVGEGSTANIGAPSKTIKAQTGDVRITAEVQTADTLNSASTVTFGNIETPEDSIRISNVMVEAGGTLNFGSLISKGWDDPTDGVFIKNVTLDTDSLLDITRISANHDIVVGSNLDTTVSLNSGAELDIAGGLKTAYGDITMHVVTVRTEGYQGKVGLIDITGNIEANRSGVTLQGGSATVHIVTSTDDASGATLVTLPKVYADGNITMSYSGVSGTGLNTRIDAGNTGDIDVWGTANVTLSITSRVDTIRVDGANSDRSKVYYNEFGSDGPARDLIGVLTVNTESGFTGVMDIEGGLTGDTVKIVSALTSTNANRFIGGGGSDTLDLDESQDFALSDVQFDVIDLAANKNLTIQRQDLESYVSTVSAATGSSTVTVVDSRSGTGFGQASRYDLYNRATFETTDVTYVLTPSPNSTSVVVSIDVEDAEDLASNAKVYFDKSRSGLDLLVTDATGNRNFDSTATDYSWFTQANLGGSGDIDLVAADGTANLNLTQAAALHAIAGTTTAFISSTKINVSGSFDASVAYGNLEIADLGGTSVTLIDTNGEATIDLTDFQTISAVGSGIRFVTGTEITIADTILAGQTFGSFTFANLGGTTVELDHSGASLTLNTVQENTLTGALSTYFLGFVDTDVLIINVSADNGTDRNIGAIFGGSNDKINVGGSSRTLVTAATAANNEVIYNESTRTFTVEDNTGAVDFSFTIAQAQTFSGMSITVTGEISLTIA